MSIFSIEEFSVASHKGVLAQYEYKTIVGLAAAKLQAKYAPFKPYQWISDALKFLGSSLQYSLLYAIGCGI